MGAAALAVVAHVPDPRRSGTVASVYDPHESCTLAFALAQTGVSLATVAESTGVSKTRAAQWACPDHEAEPHLGHVRRMPASVRRALGQQLLGGAQVREKTDDSTVDEYATAYTDGAAFPPIVVFFDGERHWLADGFHRVAACQQAGLTEVLAEVREGTREDALWFALSANKQHGRPMSSADKRRAIGLALATNGNKSDREIANHIGVSHHTVAKTREEMGCPTGQNAQLDTKTEGADGRLRPAPGTSTKKVQTFLAADPENAKLSNRTIAEKLGVSPETVGKVRKAPAAVAPKEPKAPTATKTVAPAQITTPAVETTAPSSLSQEPTAMPVITALPDSGRLSFLRGVFNKAMESTMPAYADARANDLEELLRKWGALP